MTNYLWRIIGLALLFLPACGPLANLSIGASSTDDTGIQQAVIRSKVDFQLIGNEDDKDEDKSP